MFLFLVNDNGLPAGITTEKMMLYGFVYRYGMKISLAVNYEREKNY